MTTKEWNERKALIKAYRAGKITRAQFVNAWGVLWVSLYNSAIDKEEK